MATSHHEFATDWNSENVDAHRRGFNDIEWARLQPQNKPGKYLEGDVVEFMAGGYGLISEISPEDNGWPRQYIIRPINDLEFHPRGKAAWHYDLDLRRKVKIVIKK